MYYVDPHCTLPEMHLAPQTHVIEEVQAWELLELLEELPDARSCGWGKSFTVRFTSAEEYALARRILATLRVPPTGLRHESRPS